MARNSKHMTPDELKKVVAHSKQQLQTEGRKIERLAEKAQDALEQSPVKGSKEVLAILAKIEKQFHALCDDQELQVSQALELIRQTRTLERAEARFDTRSEKLQEKKKELSENRRKFTSDRRKSHRQIVKESSQLDEKLADLTQESKKITSKRQRIRALQIKLTQQQADFDEQAEIHKLDRAAVLEQAEKHQHNSRNLSRELQQALESRQALEARIQELESSAPASHPELDQMQARELQDLKGSHNAQIQELESQITRVQQDRDQIANHADTLDAQITVLQSRFTELQSETSDSAEVDSTQQQALETQNLEQSQRIESLQKDLAQAKSELDSASTSSESDSEIPAEILHAQSRLQEIASHLQLRQHRLKRLRFMLSLQTRSTTVSSSEPQDFQKLADEKRWISNEKQKLHDHQLALSTSEKKMIKRWSLQNSALLITALVVVATLVGLGSWFSADYLSPAQISASVSLKPQTRDFKPLTAEQAQSWQLWHAELTQVPSFRQTLLKRMQDRQMPVEDIDLNERLGSSLTLDRGDPRELTLTLSGTDRRETVDMLDVLVSTLLIESSRQVAKRSDGAWAVATNEHKDGGIIRYAKLNPGVVSDNRLVWWFPLFVVLGIATAGLMWLVYRQLVQSKCVFNLEVEEFESGTFTDTDHDSQASP